MFTIGTLVEAFFEGETPKWKLAYLVSYNHAGFWPIKTVTGNHLLVKEPNIRTPHFDKDYSRGFTYGVTSREYIAAECDEWHRGYIMGVVARVGAEHLNA
jgi:hypothetical protein